MKYLISLLILSLILIFSCNTQNDKSGLFSQENLPIEKFTINTDKDTVIQTANKALLKILAGTLEGKTGNSVTLEIKEAYSIQQIIKARLFTQSNGQALSSGGMIYINAAAGQEVTFKQKIQVAIPTNFLQKGMELYKGEQKSDGTVNWINPDTLPENKQLSSVEKGKILFQKQCASCHAIGKDMSGPNLAHLQRLDKGWEADGDYYLHFIEYLNKRSKYNSDTTDLHSSFDAIHAYKCTVRAMFGSLGTSFPELTWESRNDIHNYIQNESDRNNLPYPSHAYLRDCIDSCELYFNKTIRLRELKSLSQQQRQKLIKDNGEMTVVLPDSLLPNTRRVTPADFDRKVSPENFSATYYQFTIDSFGWFNIDILLNSVDGVKESELFVRITGEYRERINIFLIIPSVKVYGEGGPADGNIERYAFFTKDGKIPLPQNEKAYILAVSEQDEKIAFVLKEFRTGLRLEFDISLQASTKEKFDLAVKSFDAARLHIKVDKTINADSIIARDREIKNIDKQLKEAETLKPKGCNCDCGTITPASPELDTAIKK